MARRSAAALRDRGWGRVARLGAGRRLGRSGSALRGSACPRRGRDVGRGCGHKVATFRNVTWGTAWHRCASGEPGSASRGPSTVPGGDLRGLVLPEGDRLLKVTTVKIQRASRQLIVFERSMTGKHLCILVDTSI